MLVLSELDVSSIQQNALSWNQASAPDVMYLNRFFQVDIRRWSWLLIHFLLPYDVACLASSESKGVIENKNQRKKKNIEKKTFFDC